MTPVWAGAIPPYFFCATPGAGSGGESQDGVLARFLPDHEVQERIGRHRVAEQVALRVVAAVFAQEASWASFSTPSATTSSAS